VANAPATIALIDSLYDIGEVVGFALGVHPQYVAQFRARYGPAGVNEILADERVPGCVAANMCQCRL